MYWSRGGTSSRQFVVRPLPFLVLSMAAFAGVGCTFSDGAVVGEMSATLQARYDGAGWQRLAGDLELRLLEFEIRDVVVELTDDDKEGEVALALAGGTLDLLEPESQILSCADGCRLDRGQLSSIQLTAARVQLRGKVRDRSGAARIDGELPFSAGFALDGAWLEHSIDVPLDDDHEPMISMQLELPVDTRLLAPVPFATVEVAPDRTLQLERERDVIDGLRERFVALELGVEIERSAE
jgi:hypothetical protein